jgi:murein DD-endopeptidase MepM/ murein hydrolase activator NlpD
MPVKAALAGTVLEVNHGAVKYCQYGKWVLVRHGNGLTTLYAHLSEINVQKGAAVSTGQTIGRSGDSGYALGPHLHFTVYASSDVSLKQYTCKSGYTVTIPIAPVNAYLNPLSYLPAL